MTLDEFFNELIATRSFLDWETSPRIVGRAKRGATFFDPVCAVYTQRTGIPFAMGSGFRRYCAEGMGISQEDIIELNKALDFPANYVSDVKTRLVDVLKSENEV